jgi:hypothetical protein
MLTKKSGAVLRFFESFRVQKSGCDVGCLVAENVEL